MSIKGFPGGSVVKNPSANAGDVGFTFELGRSLGEGNGPQQRQSPRGTHKAVCWCGLSLGSEEHADLFAGRKDQESPRLGASGGLGDVQDWGAITQGTRRCEDRAAQPP